MEKILAVLTKERKYAERFCSYCNRKNNLVFTAVPFDDAAVCGDFSKKHNIEVLLADSSFFGSGYGQDGYRKAGIKAARVLRLTDGISFDRALADSAGQGVPKDTINKYQPAETIIRDVMNSCDGLDILKTTENLGRPVRVIGIYSPISRSGKSSFALTLSKSLSRKYKTLYLSLEEFSGLESLTGEHYSSGLSDALYHMKQGTLTAQKIATMIYSYRGIDYIPPIRYADDRNAVSGEDLVHLVDLILKNTLYEVVVIDMNRFADEASELMDICNIVYMPVLDNYIDRMKIDNFTEYLKSSDRSRLLEKIVQINTPEPEPVRNKASYIDTLLYGKMGDLVRELKEA